MLAQLRFAGCATGRSPATVCRFDPQEKSVVKPANPGRCMATFVHLPNMAGVTKCLCKTNIVGTCFIQLKGSLDIFRKSHKVSALNVDPFRVKLRVESVD